MITNKKIYLFITSKIFEYVLLSIILLTGFGVRLYKINNPVADWHSWRQADTASVTRRYINDGINLLVPKFDDISSIQSGILNLNGYRMVEFPFYNFFSAVTYKTFPYLTIEVWSRLVTIFSALISAFIMYLLGNRFVGKYGGLLAAFFYLFIPYNIYFTRVILPDPLGVTFGLASLWFFARYYDYEKNRDFLLSSIFFALALLIKPYLGFYIFPIIFLTLNKFGWKNIVKNPEIRLKYLIYLAIAIIPFGLWRLWEARFSEGVPFFLWAFNGNGIRFRPSFWNWIFVERIGRLILGTWGMVLFAFGLTSSKSRNYFNIAFFVGALFYFVVIATANVMHDYYQIITIPVISLLLASGSHYLLTQKNLNKLITIPLLIFSVCIMMLSGWYQVRGNYEVNHPEIIEAGKKIDEITPKDSIVVAPYMGDTAFLYQTKRKGWPAVDNSIENIIKKGADYYVSVDLNSQDTLNFEKKFETVLKTDKYIILDLHREISNKDNNTVSQ